jgi:hypothetical protein
VIFGVSGNKRCSRDVKDAYRYRPDRDHTVVGAKGDAFDEGSRSIDPIVDGLEDFLGLKVIDDDGVAICLSPATNAKLSPTVKNPYAPDERESFRKIPPLASQIVMLLPKGG